MDKFKNSNFPLIRLIPLFCLCFFLSNLYAAPAYGNEPFPLKYISGELDRTILRCESLVMERRFEEGRALFDELEKQDPDALLPSMGRLLILMAHYLERGAPREILDESFKSEFAINQRILRKMQKKDDPSAWDHFVMGGSLGVRGLYELENKRYVSAFMHGLSALSHFREAQRVDPQIHDVYFATGLYKYFRSVKTRYLWFLPLIRDQREEGIREIRLALDKGHYAPPACKIALVHLSEREGLDEEGMRMGEEYLGDYPGSLLIRDGLARIYERQERWRDAARTYREGYRGDVSIRWVLLQAGRDYVRADALDEGEESFRAYLTSDPSSAGAAQAHLGLSRIYRSAGDDLRAQTERDRAVLLDPTLKDLPGAD